MTGVWRRVNGRLVLAALLGCAALLLCAPAALAIATGKITGTVTEAGPEKPLTGIEVNVYEAEGKNSEVGSAFTNAKGEYTVELPAGKYKVEFVPGFESSENLVRQFYEGQPSFVVAKVVEVVIAEPAKSEKIDAKMEVGAEIEGTVTDAATHKALPNAFVLAIGAGEGLGGFAVTNSSGRYTIEGLATGSYKVEFVAGGYVPQFYNGQSSFASANPVEVVQKNVRTGIDAALMPKAPINTAAPVASGTPAVGQTLSCTTGSWTGTPAPTFAYAWLRDGVAIPGASTSTYVVQAADQGNGLTCKVTAKNASGTVAAVSNTLTVPIPPPPPPVIALLSSRLAVLGGAARVPIACAGANCAGTIELTEQVVVRHRHGHRKIRRTLVLGSVPYALAAGHSATVPVGLSATARRALAAARHHRLAARIAVSVIGGAAQAGSVVLIGPAPRHKHRHR